MENWVQIDFSPKAIENDPQLVQKTVSIHDS